MAGNAGKEAFSRGIILSEVIALDMEKIKEIAVPIFRRYGVVKAFVFGSYARGEQNEESDVDFLIEYAPGARRSLFTHARIIDELKEALKKDVDVITENSLCHLLREKVLRQKRAIM
ncbi:MAG TPA: nucleotidyltransferase family protein [Desulfotomaculum sp.]|nr:nucleotidyltransferase family protein [Desulfotomaculum sp.]